MWTRLFTAAVEVAQASFVGSIEVVNALLKKLGAQSIPS